MPDVPKHAWTHRPKAQGGSDPIQMPAIAYPVIHNLLWPNEGGEKQRDPSISTAWSVLPDTTEYGTFKYQNSNVAGTTFYESALFLAMPLGPTGSWWKLGYAADLRSDGALVTFTMATDPSVDNLTDPRDLTYYAPSTTNVMDLSGGPTTDRGIQFGFEVGGAPGIMLTAAGGSAFPSLNGGPGIWWLKILVADNGDPANIAAVFRDLTMVRFVFDTGATVR